jgi:mannose-6-phosphate isomerase-like protein (cupin superfamily)
VEGRMTLYIDNQTLTLSEGDAVYFDAKHPHAMQAEGGACRFLAIIAK